ncbi:hypothetical protein PUN28_012029 [Cardiocondyla obscurior]|uniref:Uncharacterized protein n=1 Tax=Cardiocondyla obscurior TaxID=286306 RepID=A0AAW2FD98_9HYME
MFLDFICRIANLRYLSSFAASRPAIDPRSTRSTSGKTASLLPFAPPYHRSGTLFSVFRPADILPISRLHFYSPPSTRGRIPRRQRRFFISYEFPIDRKKTTFIDSRNLKAKHFFFFFFKIKSDFILCTITTFNSMSNGIIVLISDNTLLHLIHSPDILIFQLTNPATR